MSEQVKDPEIARALERHVASAQLAAALIGAIGVVVAETLEEKGVASKSEFAARLKRFAGNDWTNPVSKAVIALAECIQPADDEHQPEKAARSLLVIPGGREPPEAA